MFSGVAQNSGFPESPGTSVSRSHQVDTEFTESADDAGFPGSPGTPSSRVNPNSVFQGSPNLRVPWGHPEDSLFPESPGRLRVPHVTRNCCGIPETRETTGLQGHPKFRVPGVIRCTPGSWSHNEHPGFLQLPGLLVP